QHEDDAAQGSGHGDDEETRQAGAERHGLLHEQWPALHDAGQPQPIRDQFLIQQTQQFWVLAADSRSAAFFFSLETLLADFTSARTTVAADHWIKVKV